MPGGDGTGPMGFGPFTGRGAGYCAGFPAPGYANPFMGRGWFGRGWGSRGRGMGRRWFAPMAWPYMGGYMPYGPAGMTPSQEAQYLRSQTQALQAQLEELEARLGELEDAEEE
jgi:hypothetical protein